MCMLGIEDLGSGNPLTNHTNADLSQTQIIYAPGLIDQGHGSDLGAES